MGTLPTAAVVAAGIRLSAVLVCVTLASVVWPVLRARPPGPVPHALLMSIVGTGGGLVLRIEPPREGRTP
ncbi:MAG TPA: hypothetical protein VKW76_16960 [Candidatus Binatia bacterium]|nr:hypothetical protein [Candidatus Binatia bacterium]